MASKELLEKYGFKEEEIELARSNAAQQIFGPTGFPKPKHRYRVVYETPHRSIEEVYYWFLNELTVGQAHPNLIKVTDIFSASEQSSFFGTAQQRIGLQQEKVSMFLATIGKMVKELFQLVREIRILKERLGYYEDSFVQDSRSRESAEITLKGIWVDMVEQGAKNPASVYGMARELQFVTLPDLFYSIHPPTPSHVDQYVDRLEFNRKVKEVLKRKLRQFAEWKKSTQKEIQVRHDFTLKYLRQHFDIIKMYMTWVKPYLRNIRRMQFKDKTSHPEMINAFEGSLVELEFIAHMMPSKRSQAKEVVWNKNVMSVIVAHFDYRTRPQMNYSQEYQRGPLHVGKCDVTLRGYTWTKKEMDNYLEMNDEDDMKLLESIDASVKAAMEALGDELEDYLKEAGEKVDFAKELGKNKMSDKAKKALDPFTSIFRGFGDVLSSFSSGKKKVNSMQIKHEKETAYDVLKNAMWQTYKNFKKKEGFTAW